MSELEATTIKKRLYYMLNEGGRPVLNVLEINEAWCWASLYAKRHRDNFLPSEVPPDWIERKKGLGYKCASFEVELEL
jgi:hypothetical protein